MSNRTTTDFYKDKVGLGLSLKKMTGFPNHYPRLFDKSLVENELSKCSEDQILGLIKKHFTVMAFLSEVQKTERVVQLHKMLWEI